jgi:hypothetical protein
MSVIVRAPVDYRTDFYEEDDSLEKVAATWAQGPQGVTGSPTVIRHQEPTLAALDRHDQEQSRRRDDAC